MKKKLRYLKTVTLCLSFLLLGKAAFTQIDTQRLKKHIYFLADDKMKGRGTGSKQVQKAADYIEKEFKRYGLLPKGEKGYRQTFTAKVTRIVVKDSIRKADNIIGYIDNGAPYTIVVGAHYDHLGEGHQGSSRDSLGVGKIHNGADDNASGVAGLLELARYYATNNEKEKCNLLFVAFGAEELGLLGSKYFTQNPTLPLKDVHWMLNMDMIGRYNPENGVAIIGYGTSSKFPSIFADVKSDIKFYTSRHGNGGSDQTSFYKKDIPVLFFHTGGHDDYHKPGDDADKINYKALHSILELERQIIDNSMNEVKMDFIWTN